MNIAITSRNPHRLEMHKSTIHPYLSHISDKPDVVLTVGGDGSFLSAERFFPGIPKLLVREDSICKKCTCDSLSEALERLMKNHFNLQNFSKLAVTVKGIKKEAANDVIIRNIHPTHAIRF